MYGSVLGASVTAGAVAVLPNTGGSKVEAALTIATMTVGAAITVVTLAKAFSAKYFA
jgi:hypothetical protein